MSLYSDPSIVRNGMCSSNRRRTVTGTSTGCVLTLKCRLEDLKYTVHIRLVNTTRVSLVSFRHVNRD